MVGDLAELALELGRPDDAAAYGREALTLAADLRDRQHMVFSLALLARMAAERGHFEWAGRLWGAIEAEEQRGAIGWWERHRDEAAAPVLAHAGPEFERGREEGRRLSLDQAVEEALLD